MVGAGFEYYVYNLSIFTCSYHNRDAYVVRHTPYVVRHTPYVVRRTPYEYIVYIMLQLIYRIHRLHSISFTTNVS